MVCRTTRIGSAITSHARLASGLQDEQALSTFHALIREGRDAPEPTSDQVTRLIDERIEAVRQDPNLSDARRTSIINRLEQARAQPMNGSTYYAASHLMERAETARTSLDGYYDSVSRDMGVPRARAEAMLAEHVAVADGDRNVRAPADWHREFGARTENTGLPLDRQTAYGIHQLEQARAARHAQAQTRPAVDRQPVGSSAIASMGYDSSTGRVEVEMRSRPGVPYVYRMDQESYEQFRQAPSLGNHFARNVRGNTRYQYSSAEEQAATAEHVQCATCGRFAARSHSCPVRDSAEERNRTVRQARQAVSGDAAAAGAPEPRRLASRAAERSYRGESGTFRTMNLSDVRVAARSSAVSLPVVASISHTAESGAGTESRGRVSGRVNVEHRGRAGGYAVSAVTSPGDSGQDQLRCTCAAYRSNYDCEHVRQAVADMTARLNADRIRQPHQLHPFRVAEAEVGADLARDRSESIEAQANARTSWGTPEVSYAEDPAAFQEAYTAAKTRIAAGEEPVPYMTENATDGLGSRNGGRGFGVEMEFDLDGTANRTEALRNIGRELHAAGLTRAPGQTSYHAAQSRGYTDEHQGGWSFESDCTVAGEIVSPIMYDEPETWENISKVCEIVERNGGVATVRAGSHVHVSAHNYDHTVENHNRLLRLHADHEDVLVRLASNPTRGTHRGSNWCRPNHVPASGYASVSDARYSSGGHGTAVNLQSVSGRASDHVEFRTWDATLKPSQIQAQVKLSLAMTEAAFRDTTPSASTAREPLGTHRSNNRATHGASRRLTGDAWKQDTASFRTFADKLFRRTEDKAQIAALFAATKWQQSGSRR